VAKVNTKNHICLGCHREIGDGYYFCSITCACLCGFMHVRTDGTKRDMKELEIQENVDYFLNNPPRRIREEKYL